MQYLLTPAMKTEVSRLDDPGMDRPNANLVDAVALDRKKRVAFDGTASFRRTRFSLRISGFSRDALSVHKPATVAGAHRLEPGVMAGNDPELLIQLALKNVQSRHLADHGRILRTRLHHAACDQELGPAVPCEDANQLDAFPSPYAEQGDRSRPVPVAHGAE